MASTKKKLNEAKFFLDLLEANYSKDPDFDYFLSAYISSSRSVLWIMRAEYSEINGWEQWFDSLNPPHEEKLFLKKINDIRVRTEKVEPLLTKILMQVGIPNEEMTEEIENYLERFQGKKVTLTIETIEDESENENFGIVENGSIRFKGKVDSVFRAIDDFPDIDILEICKEYFRKLENLVNECYKNFSNELEEKNSGRLKVKLNKFDS